MDEMLKAGLLPDEKILWRGKAEPFTTLDKTHKKRFIICAGIGLLITALVAVAYFAAVLSVRLAGSSKQPIPSN